MFQDNEGGIVVTEKHLSTERSKDIYTWWHFIEGLAKTKAITMTHVELGWQRAGILRRRCLFRSSKDTRRDL